MNEGSKGVWLGLGDPVRELPRAFAPATPPPSDVTDVRVYCGGCLVVGGPSFADDPKAAARLASHPAFAGWPLVVLTDEPARATRSDMNFLWTTFTRFEPAADIHAAAHQRGAQPHRLRAADPDRRPHEAVVPEGSDVPRGHRGDGHRALEANTSRRGKVEMGDSERGHLD